MANYGLTTFSAQETRNPSMSAVIVLGGKPTVGTRKTRYFVAQDREYEPASKIARTDFTQKQEESVYSAMSRVKRALVPPTIVQPAQTVITRKTKRAWLNVGVVSFSRAARALTATRRAGPAKERQTTARRVTLLSTKMVRAV